MFHGEHPAPNPVSFGSPLAQRAVLARFHPARCSTWNIPSPTRSPSGALRLSELFVTRPTRPMFHREHSAPNLLAFGSPLAQQASCPCPLPSCSMFHVEHPAPHRHFFGSSPAQRAVLARFHPARCSTWNIPPPHRHFFGSSPAQRVVLVRFHPARCSTENIPPPTPSPSEAPRFSDCQASFPFRS